MPWGKPEHKSLLHVLILRLRTAFGPEGLVRPDRVVDLCEIESEGWGP